MKEQYKTIDDAFKEYPAEEELWNYNELWISDVEEKSIYKKGDLVFVSRFVYPNNKKGDKHLFLIIDDNLYALECDYLSMTASSKISKLKYKYNHLLLADDTNGLHKDSIIKTDQLFIINHKDIIGKIGNIAYEKVDFFIDSHERSRNEKR